jgi:ABC-type multidrug transport system ATPase subunit
MIRINGLTKVFGSYTAVDHLNLQIMPGEIYGFLGPNGAGKTTTLMMILGIVKPTSGTVSLFGKSMSEDPFGIRRRIGVVAEAQNFYDDMTAWEYLQFFGKLYTVEKAQQRAEALLEKLNLWQWRNVLLGGYSTGMRRKLGFIRALLHSPELIILDEPVSGLDPFGIVQIRELLLEEKSRGTTALISSHILSEIEKTADRVGIIARGHLVIEDCTDKIRQSITGEHRIEIETVDPSPNLPEKLQAFPFVKRVEKKSEQLFSIHTQDDRDYRAELGRELAGMGIAIQRMQSMESSLEDAFITLTESYINTLTGNAMESQKEPL